MKKKFLALVLTLAMVLSLVPVTALAAGETTNEDVIVKPAESQTYPEGVDSLSKTAVKADGENTYDVTLEVKMHETTTTTSQAAATVLVIDVSNSMDWHVVCGRDEHKHTRDCYTFGWLTCEETEHTHTDACGESRLDAAKAAAENFVNTYAGSVENAGRYLSIVVFGTTASVKLDWTDVSTDDGKENVISAIDEIGVNGGTNLEQGLAKAKDQFDDPTVTSVNFKNVVALTDGAPTYYGLDNKGEPSGGNGSSGSEKINTKTAKTAGKLKEVANLYTVCFGAANQYTYTESDWWGNITHGPTVGEFLRNNIATDSNHAYDADNAGALNSVFEKISETITSGISAGVVHDALPTGVTSSAFNGETTADWDLNTFDKQTSDEGNTKHYTYTKTYTVTIGPDEIDSTLLYENVYYPLNGETTLKVNVDNEEQELNFQIPYGKVTFNTYSVTYKDGVNGAVFEDNTTNDLRKGATIPGFAGESSIEREGYTFSGWKWYQGETELTAKPDTMPAADLVAVAQWTANTYTVTWKDWNGTELKKVEKVAYGTTASDVAEKAPADPIRASSAQYDYTFTGWDKEYADVTGDQVYTAQYRETAKTYTVTWKDWNGTELKKVEEVAYGTTASDVAEKAPADPSRASSAQYDYTFTGWDKEYADVTGDQVYTAQYRETAVANLDYKIIQHFRDAKGNEIEKLRVDSPKTITAADAEKITSLNTLVEKEGMAKNMTDASSNNYVYVPNETTFKADGKDVTTLIKGTQIDLYYYLDNWKDGDSKTPTEGDSETGGDGIPDCYQVLVKYQSGDTNRGSVGPLTMEVLTIKNKENVSVGEGQVVASGSTATATGNRCYFSRWTNDAKVETSTAGAALGQQTIANAKGGATYTFTANFDRSSGGGSGGSNRPKPPVVEIPDDVPTGLNGKDHYAYVVGYPDGMVYPQKNITRAEVATIFFRLLKDETREANMTKSNSYNDMKDGAWYTCAVSTLSKMGIIKGYEDGSFKPDASISRAEFAAIAARFDPDGDKTPATFSDVSSHWAKDEISIAANHGWIKGYEDGSFKPDQKITRAETMTLVNRVLKRLPETKDDLHKDMKTWPDNQKESAWFYLAVQEATNSHYQKLKKDGTHETWESMRETRDWAALEK